MVTGYVSWRHTGWSPKSSVNIDQHAEQESVESQATKGTDKKYFLNLSIQVGFEAKTVSYCMAVWGSYPEGKVDGT